MKTFFFSLLAALTLGVATAQSGASDLSFAGGETERSGGKAAPFVSDLALSPNPVVGRAALRYHLDAGDTVSVDLYDMQGRLVRNLLAPALRPAGDHEEPLFFDAALPLGVYFLMMETPHGSRALSIVC